MNTCTRFAASLIGVVLSAVACAAVSATGSPATVRYFGADLSFANEMKDCGARYYEQGRRMDVYRLFKEHGANLIRIRLWNDATWTRYSGLPDVERSIARAKAVGLQVLLDFHYSDDWADGHTQKIPRAWAHITDPHKLAAALYHYTYGTLMALAAKGLEPDMVQIGNEINIALLEGPDWPKDRPIDWTRNALLINAGIGAVRAASRATGKPIKVMLHIAQPENVVPWFAAATRAGVTDFDLIGISYYPKWSKDTLAQLGATIAKLRATYPRAGVMVVETAYPWALGWADDTPNVLGKDSLLAGYPPTPAGQAHYLIELSRTVIANGGDGVLYWAPAWVSTSCRTRWGVGSAWENATLFDFQGNVLPGIGFMDRHYRAHRY